MGKEKFIQLLYEESQVEEAAKIVDFFVGGKIASLLKQEYGVILFRAEIDICSDSVIVYISDAAVENAEWQKNVRSIIKNVRIIPVGATENADYSDPNIIPPIIEEINFIRLDEHVRENILDSLIIEPDFYEIKNRLEAQTEIWEMSGRAENYLIDNLHYIKQSQSLMYKKRENETEDIFIMQIEKIIEYLSHSFAYAKRLEGAKRRRKINTMVEVIIAVAFIVLFIIVLPIFHRASYARIVMNVDTQAAFAPITAVKLTEGLTNPFVSEQIKGVLGYEIRKCLDKNWSYSALGPQYKWAMNDATIADDTKYIWAANGNGSLTKNDRISGEISISEQVSDNPMAAIAITKQEEFFAAIDSNGYIFTKTRTGNWNKSEQHIDIPFSREENILISENGKLLTVYDKSEIYIILNDSKISLVQHYKYDDVKAVKIIENEIILAAVRENNQFKLIEISGSQIVNENIIPRLPDCICNAAILGDNVIFADQNGQICIWNRNNPINITSAGIVLNTPICLAFINDSVIAYCDREVGTHLYNIESMIDLGSCLQPLVSCERISVSNNQLLGMYLGLVCTEDISRYLPLSTIPTNKVTTSFYSQSDENKDGLIQAISITNKYLVAVKYSKNDRQEIILIDGGNHLFTGIAQNDTSLISDYSSGYNYLPLGTVSFTGKPTVVGILDDGESFFIGASDGSFYELIFTKTGGYLIASTCQVPSHCAIAGVLQTDDCYYLLDGNGAYWYARIGYKVKSNSELISAVKNKLKYAITDDIYKQVSKDTIEELNVVVWPTN
jgi:preprotein translocase subunit SecE